MKFKCLIISILIVFAGALSAQDAAKYVRQYESIAVSEMLRTGIPASIKLAQGMLESNCGSSELAFKANNHFGIKCGGDWSGRGFHKEDDDFRNGELIKSCFREFDSAFESFIAHSDFLMDPKKVQRYGPLFQLDPSDYKGWAKGLSKAGYATDPQYADKLIRIIEDNKLYAFDDGDDTRIASAKPGSSLGYSLIRYNNDVRYVLAQRGDLLATIAERYDVTENQLQRYNDQVFQPDQPISEGAKIYLQPKRAKFHGKQKFYMLKPGQDLNFVAQEFGIKLSALQKRNGIENNRVPKPGQKILLKGKAKEPVKTNNPYDLPEAPEGQPKEEMSSSVSTPATASSGNNGMANHRPSMDSAVPVVTGSIADGHVVAKGETLYSISRVYGLSVDDLKKRNNLSVDTIFVGQKLMVQ